MKMGLMKGSKARIQMYIEIAAMVRLRLKRLGRCEPLGNRTSIMPNVGFVVD